MGVTPMIAQYREIKREHEDAILFYRLGDFYEMFFEDAEVAARELDLVLTGRDGGKSLGRIPMCGVPYHAAEGYIARLIERGYKIAICEQVEDPKAAKGLVRREVVRVVTPGTLVEPKLLEEKQNNFLVALCRGKGGFGLALADLSTGQFAACQVADLAAVLDEVTRLEPAEVLIEPGLSEEPRLMKLLANLGTTASPYSPLAFTPAEAEHQLREHFQVASLHGFGLVGLPLATGAAGALLQYLLETQKTQLGHITGLAVYEPGAFMTLDGATRRNLEITRRIADGERRGSLLWVLDRTMTSMGGRTLKGWLERPLLSLPDIVERHGAVGELVDKGLLRADLRELLKDIYDMERLIGRISYGSANAKDLVALRNSLVVLPSIKILLGDAISSRLQHLRDQIDLLDDVRDLITNAIEDDPPFALNEGGLIKQGYHEEVDRLRRIQREGKGWIAALEGKEREKTGIKSLKVGYNKVFGYYIEVTNANLSLVPDEYIRKQTLTNAERYITEELKQLEGQVLGAEEGLTALEYQLFTEVRAQIAAQVERIQASARAIAELDALASLAEVAVSYGYVRPIMEKGQALQIRDGRHPVVERLVAEGSFVPNDTQLNLEDERLLLITGPNMGGKSTYMRQVALICLMAQAGSFVPASHARLGVVDRIFTRVGASDDLATGQSTFMVEMTELANILNSATRQSLIILDEIGRGTATFDGLSIAWAVVEYVAKQVGAKCLFATHYHELCDLEGMLPGVKNYSVAARERGEEIIFLHKIVPGGADRSYGIQVARLAGVPKPVLTRAREILNSLEREGVSAGASRLATGRGRRQESSTQLSFLVPPPPERPHPIIEELRELNVNHLSPIEALNLLYQLHERAKQ